MTAGVIRLICSRTYFQDSIDHIGDSRVFDVPIEEPALIDQIKTGMEEQGWEVTVEEL
jgi:hypothetical protein